jgi:IclR family mhp operon transcriptional activator
MPTPSNPTYKHVNALSRGLEILRALNEAEHSRSSPSAIGKRVGLNRTTVRRILETLQRDGYVTHCEYDGSFCLTADVRHLSNGFDDADSLSGIASPILRSLSEDILWPSDFATASGDAMVIRESTHKMSPLSFSRVSIGEQRPILTTALGRAFLSFCSQKQRDALIEVLCARDRDPEPRRRLLAAISRLVDETRKRGYAANFGEWRGDPRISAIAVPVFGVEDNILGTVNIISITRAMTVEMLVERFLERLRLAAQEIQRTVIARGAMSD